ncbi:hypothetical protein [Alteromonas sp. 07-89-2]|uniref:hypothetical protein n=1 Tax=Alteromonas sp. 07-89-2 TaxID=2607609 RepID=UPI0020A42D00|nr:hypothetical protein [Alteromonas sp. 07-89-2]
MSQQAPLHSIAQMAANISQIKNITAQSFRLFVLTINRMLASSVFKKTKGTGSASNKALKTTPFGRSDAFTRGGFAIMPHANAPLSLMLVTTRKFEPNYGRYLVRDMSVNDK